MCGSVCILVNVIPTEQNFDEIFGCLPHCLKPASDIGEFGSKVMVMVTSCCNFPYYMYAYNCTLATLDLKSMVDCAGSRSRFSVLN